MFDKVAEFCRVFCRVLASPEFLKFFGLAELLQNPSFSSMILIIIWNAVLLVIFYYPLTSYDKTRGLLAYHSTVFIINFVIF